jgi:hypothetical protein
MQCLLLQSRLLEKFLTLEKSIYKKLFPKLPVDGYIDIDLSASLVDGYIRQLNLIAIEMIDKSGVHERTRIGIESCNRSNGRNQTLLVRS